MHLRTALELLPAPPQQPPCGPSQREQAELDGLAAAERAQRQEDRFWGLELRSSSADGRGQHAVLSQAEQATTELRLQQQREADRLLRHIDEQQRERALSDSAESVSRRAYLKVNFFCGLYLRMVVRTD